MKKIIVLLFVALFVFGCKQVSEKNKDAAKAINSETPTGFEVTEQIKEVYHRFPSPEEMLSIIDVKGINYNEQLLNSPGKSNQYLDSRNQALNLGVYAADLAYLTLFEQHNASVSYFEVLYGLSDKLQVSSAFDRALLIRIQENVTNSDSLQNISEEALISLSNYLESTDNEKIFALISIGGFIEALYLSFNLAGEYHEDNPVVQKIADQKYVLENIVRYANLFVDDNSIKGALEEISTVREAFAALETQKTETTVSKDKDGKLIVAGGSKLLITIEQYDNLETATRKTRMKITQN
jgi:hypothetical protein